MDTLHDSEMDKQIIRTERQLENVRRSFDNVEQNAIFRNINLRKRNGKIRLFTMIVLQRIRKLDRSIYFRSYLYTITVNAFRTTPF